MPYGSQEERAVKLRVSVVAGVTNVSVQFCYDCSNLTPILGEEFGTYRELCDLEIYYKE